MNCFRFGSLVAELIAAVLTSAAPFGIFEGTLTVRVSTALTAPPAAKLGRVQVIVPPLSTGGVAQFKSGAPTAFCVNETNVVPAGSVSITETDCASLGPLLLMVIV